MNTNDSDQNDGSLSQEEQDALERLIGPNLSREKVEERLKIYGIHADELSTLFPKDEDLFRFYLSEFREGGSLVLEDTEEVPSDDYKLTESNKHLLGELKSAEEKKRKQALLDAVCPEQLDAAARAKASFEAESEKSGTNLSYEDLIKSLREGLGLD